MKANYHTHTTRCQHARGTDQEMVLAAIEGGFSVLGFADHAPWPFASGYVSRTRMTCDQLPGYVASIRGLREKYADRLTLHIGLETEYFPRYYHHLGWLRDQGVEYFILGQHNVGSEEDNPYVGFDAQTDDGVRRYAEAAVQGIRTGLYRYVAHPDLFMRARDDDRFNAACEEATDMICQAAKEQGMPLEYNLLGLAVDRLTGGKRGYPCPPFWQRARRWDNDVILGVDAHDPGSLTDEVVWARAKQEVLDMGYRLIDQLDMEV